MTKEELERELRRTEPDYVVFVPDITGDADRAASAATSTGNEHFLVFDGPDDSLMAVWTQSTHEGAGDHHIVFARSDDEGASWTPPTHVAGPRFVGDGHMASWGFPLISTSGRIYVVWNQYHGIDDVIHQFTGTMDACYSDDMGKTWSQPGTIPMTRNIHDHPDPQIHPNWIVWQRPIRDLEGKWFTGYSHWVSKAVRHQPHRNSWTAMESVVEFMRFENIDADPEPAHVQVTYSPGDRALRVPHYENPVLSVAQEPSLVRLPDDRLFCVMRTMAGCIWYSVSADDGLTWSHPGPLLRRDYGEPILEPICCCPMYQLADGRYVLLHHNNSGRLDGCTPEDTGRNRRPAYIALAEFRPGARQPLWFSDSKVLMDIGEKGLGPQGRRDIGIYSSFTTRQGNNVLWHPDRKFFLLGKRITQAFLADLTVPEKGCSPPKAAHVARVR